MKVTRWSIPATAALAVAIAGAAIAQGPGSMMGDRRACGRGHGFGHVAGPSWLLERL